MSSLEYHIIEFIAVVTSLLYVFFAGKNKAFCWYFAIISSSIYVYINADAQLYFFAFLQLFYVIIAFYGWAVWKSKGDDFPVKFLGWRNIPIITLGTIVALLLAYFVKEHTNQKLPYLDALNFIFCLIASFMIARKYMESWIYLVVFDLVSVYIYFEVNLYQSAILYVLLAGFGAYALRDWWITYRKINSNLNDSI